VGPSGAQAANHITTPNKPTQLSNHYETKP